MRLQAFMLLRILSPSNIQEALQPSLTRHEDRTFDKFRFGPACGTAVMLLLTAIRDNTNSRHVLDSNERSPSRQAIGGRLSAPEGV